MVGDLAQHHLAGAAVDGEEVAVVHHDIAHLHDALLLVDAQIPGAGDARPSHAAGDHRGMAGHAAAGRQHAGGGMHAVDILGAGLGADQDHLLALGGAVLGLIGAEDGAAGRRPWRGRQAAGDDLARGLGIEGRMQELVEGGGLDARDGLALVDQPLVHHIDGDLERRLGRALAGAGLQHIELAALHRELDVLHVAVMGLELAAHLLELGEERGHRLFHGRQLGAVGLLAGQGQGLRRADAGDHILALGVDQELAVELVAAGGGIAGEGDARGAIVAHIAEDHGLDIDRRAPFLGDGVELAIGDGARRAPAAEDSADGAPELLQGILGEGLCPAPPAPWP